MWNFTQLKISKSNTTFIFLFFCSVIVKSQVTKTFIDNFNTLSYSNNNGTENWASDWVETNEDTNFNGGRISIRANMLNFQNLDNISISRTLDLSNASSVVLSLNYNSIFRGGEVLLVQLWNNTTSGWDTAITISNNTIATATYNLTSGQISSASAIRLISGPDTNWDGSDTITLDNITFTSSYPDRDNDGVEDSADLDNDNDGILDADECALTTTNLVANGDFSSGYFNNWTGGGGQWQNPNQYAFYEDYSAASSTIQQTINVTTGVEHTLTFDIGTLTSYPNSTTFNVRIAGVLVYSRTSNQIFAANGGNSAHTGGGNISNTSTITIPFTPTSNSVAISFEGSAAAHSHHELFLDNISVVANDSCSDTDGDGVLNKYDLDSDNDGIYDAVEAGHNQAQTNGIVNGAVGTDGVPNSVQAAGQANSGVVNYTMANSDGDSIKDYLDADSDNDSCNDVREAGYPESSSKTGELSGTGYNSTNGLVTGNVNGYTTPTDSNSNGVYDYKEVGTLATITSQPADQSVAAGTNAIFNVVGSGSNLTYQWQVSANDGGTFTNIAGATASTLLVNNVSIAEDGNFYRVLVTNGSYVCFATTSTIAILTIATDFDGDGVTDRDDLDDDNDGILDSIESNNCGVTDPIVEVVIFTEDFGSATGNRVFTPYTNYNYEDGSGSAGGSADLQDGEYTIFENISATASWAPSIWQTQGDHISGSDRMAIFNANNTAGLEFYRRPLTKVDAGIPLQISLWAMNLDTNIPGNNGRTQPNITINIEQNGSVVYSFNTGSINREANGSPNAWKNFTGSFTPASINALELVLINNAPGGLGNDVALDDIQISQFFCDSDGDGIANIYEEDSDNDGCTDANEAYADAGADADGNGYYGTGNPPAVNADGTVVAASYQTPADGNNNGIYDFLEAGSIPIISVQPANRVGFAGGTIDFTVSDTGDTYQWQLSTDGGLNFNNISDGTLYTGAQTSTLAINPLELSFNNYQYRVIISSSSYICGNLISSSASLFTRVRTVITNRRITVRVKK